MRITVASLVFVVSMVGRVHAATPPGNTWTLDPSRSDEFNGPSLDTNRWVSGPLWYKSSGAGWPFTPENGFVADGNLNLKAAPGNPMTIAAVHSKFLIPGNSYLEVRAKCLPWAAHILTAIWLQGPFEAQYNPNVEIDIQEVFNNKKIESNLHLWNADPSKHVGDGVGHPVDVGVDVTADYHLYGLERRSPGVIKIYFDDKLVWDAKPSNPPQYASQERWLIFSLEGHLGAANTANLPAAALIDYARLYVLGSTLPAGPDGGTQDTGSAVDVSTASGAGGAKGSGGAMALGGATGVGGVVGSGGAISSGGTSGSGGTTGNGGATSTAGTAGTSGTAGATSENRVASSGCSMSGNRAWPISALLLLALAVIRRRRTRA